jgi:hypothetical protein
MPWIQESLVLIGNVELLDEGDLPLLMVAPEVPVVVGTPNGRMFLTISSRPWFVPLTRSEALQVKAALATEDASVLRFVTGSDEFTSAITALIGSWESSSI